MGEMGVSDKVVIHCKKAGFCYDVPTKEFTWVTSVDIPKSEIKGSVGAGDAFCAGCLYAIHEGYSLPDMLDFANASARFNLKSPTSTGGAPALDQLRLFLSE